MKALPEWQCVYPSIAGASVDGEAWKRLTSPSSLTGEDREEVHGHFQAWTRPTGSRVRHSPWPVPTAPQFTCWPEARAPGGPRGEGCNPPLTTPSAVRTATARLTIGTAGSLTVAFRVSCQYSRDNESYRTCPAPVSQLCSAQSQLMTFLKAAAWPTAIVRYPVITERPPNSEQLMGKLCTSRRSTKHGNLVALSFTCSMSLQVQ